MAQSHRIKTSARQEDSSNGKMDTPGSYRSSDKSDADSGGSSTSIEPLIDVTNKASSRECPLRERGTTEFRTLMPHDETYCQTSPNESPSGQNTISIMINLLQMQSKQVEQQSQLLNILSQAALHRAVPKGDAIKPDHFHGISTVATTWIGF